MFALIETNNATHIAIHIPHQGSDKSLPTLLGMLENNSVFIRKNWGTLDVVAPKITIVLGDTIKEDGRDSELMVVVPESKAVIDDSFVLATPAVFVSNKEAMERANKEAERLRTELAHVRAQLDDAQERLASIDATFEPYGSAPPYPH